METAEQRWAIFQLQDPAAARVGMRTGYATAALDLMDPQLTGDPWTLLTKWIDDDSWGTH